MTRTDRFRSASPSTRAPIAVEDFDVEQLETTSSPTGQGRGALATLFGLAFALGGLRVGLAKLDDNSFLWHFRTGRLILDEGVPHNDVYSYTVPGAKWIAQSWLAETTYALADRVAGPFGIRLLVGALGALVGWLMWSSAIHHAGDRLRAAGIALVAFVVAMNIFGERPLAFGLVAAALLVIAVEQPASVLGRRPLVAFPIVFWCWGNTHGSMSLGFVYVGLHLVGRWTEGAPPWRPGRERTMVIASVAAAAAIAVNPYGPALLVFPFDLVSRGEVLKDVHEWMSPDFRTPLGLAFGAWMVLGFVALARGRQRVSRRDVIVFVAFIVLGLWAQRNVALAAIVGLPVVARAVATRPRVETAHGRFVGGVAVLLAALTSLFVVAAAREPDFDLHEYPTRALAFVDEERRLGERIFMTDRDGGFAIAKYWPRTRVFLDDRFDMYPASVVKEYERVARAQPGWDDVLADRDVTLVVWDRRGSLVQLLALSDDWDRIYADSAYVVYERVT